MPPGEALYRYPQRALVETFPVDEGAAEDDRDADGTEEELRIGDERGG